ncbi:restriction endonuclease subunit S [Alkalibacterium iburiense]|uniref:Restriction endonuclease subunit S n=1 Tax=Alkalibacterium iburiense TaxID=290589 RepID=A0ABN0XI78_9LACT
MNAKDLKDSILQLAIKGKLVEQREEEGTAKELLKKIQVEKKQLVKEGKIKKSKALSEIKDDEIPFDIPENWEWVRVGAVGSWSAGATPLRSNPEYYGGKIPWLKTGDLNDGYITEVPEFITEEAVNKTAVRLNPMGSVLMAMYGATIGKLGILNIEATTNQACCACIPYSIVDNKFLFYFLRSQRSVYIKMGAGGAQPNISKTKIVNSIMPLPPLEEQKRIVVKIEELLPYVDKYDAAYSEVEELNKKFPEDMQKSILQYAVQGKLVEQREEDGTAEDLFNQIQEEKKKMIKEGKIKKTKKLPEITDDEIPYDIPDSWKWVRFTDIFKINPRNNVSDELGVSFIPMALIDDGYLSNFAYEVRPWGDIKKGYTHFQDGDIVMAKITPCFQNLKSALMMNLENGIGAGTTELHVLRSYSNICREFFMWFIKSPIFVSTCEKNMTGTAGQKRVPTDVLKSYVVPLPPSAEQKRIVAKIEELLFYTQRLVK